MVDLELMKLTVMIVHICTPSVQVALSQSGLEWSRVSLRRRSGNHFCI